MRRVMASSLLLTLLGCQVDALENRADAVLQRMVDQDRCAPDELTPHFGNGACNQPPPDGVVDFKAQAASPLTTGLAASGEPLQRIPLHVDRALVQEGQQHFDVFCATCHGLLGDGNSEVAENMELRRPPAFFEPRIQQLPDGRIFRVISEGYGLMPAYRRGLTVHQRWAVVAYVRVLALSQRMPLASLSLQTREEALKWLR